MSLPHDYPVGKILGGRTAPITSTNFNIFEETYVAGDQINMLESQNRLAQSPITGLITFPVGNIATARIKLVGGGGGAGGGWSNFGGNGNGGTMDVTVNLSSYAGTTLYIFFGGCGQNGIGDDSGGSNCQGGYNGGAPASNGGGGGRTDIRTISANPQTELIVAGGGGGWNGGGGVTGARYQAASQLGCVGIFDEAQGYTFEGSGGGGGYYAGISDCGDVGANAGAGSNYVIGSIIQTTHTDTRIATSNGGNSGCGWATVTVLSVN